MAVVSSVNSSSSVRPSLAPDAAHSGGMAVPGIRPMERASSHWMFCRRVKSGVEDDDVVGALNESA